MTADGGTKGISMTNGMYSIWSKLVHPFNITLNDFYHDMNNSFSFFILLHLLRIIFLRIPRVHFSLDLVEKHAHTVLFLAKTTTSNIIVVSFSKNKKIQVKMLENNKCLRVNIMWIRFFAATTLCSVSASCHFPYGRNHAWMYGKTRNTRKQLKKLMMIIRLNL